MIKSKKSNQTRSFKKGFSEVLERMEAALDYNLEQSLYAGGRRKGLIEALGREMFGDLWDDPPPEPEEKLVEGGSKETLLLPEHASSHEPPNNPGAPAPKTIDC